MSKKILSTYLKTFSREERKSFLVYLNSPLFQVPNRSRSIRTYEFLLDNYAPEFKMSKLDIESLQIELGYKNVNNVFTGLIQNAENFQSFKKYSNQRHDQAIYLLQYLKEKDLNGIFSKRAKQFKDDAWEDITYAQEKFFHLYKIYKELNTSYAVSSLDNSDDSLEHLHKYHDLHYNLIKIKALTALHAQNNTVDMKVKTSEYLEVLEKVESSDDSNFILQLFAILFRYTKETDKEILKENYFRCKALYFDNIGDIPKNDKHEIFIMLSNYCQKIHKLEEDGFMSEVFSLYRFGFKHQTLFFNDIIHPYMFFNIVQVASECGEIEWAENFLSNTSKKLAGKFQKPISALSKAYVLSSSDRCSDALVLLVQIELNDIFIALTSKILTIKCYYELNEFYALDSFLKTFQNYIRRQKQLSDAAKKRYLKFSSIVGKLMKTNSADDRKAIKSAIIEDKKLIYKNWLARMANQ